MKFTRLQIPQKLSVGLPFGTFGTFGADVSVILEIRNTHLAVFARECFLPGRRKGISYQVRDLGRAR